MTEKKPRGLNGGRKPKEQGVKRERVSIRLPVELIEILDKFGNRSDTIERLIKQHLN